MLTLFSGRPLMHPRRLHVRRALALTLTVPLLLAGCSDDPEPQPKMPETTSSSPTPTPTESGTPQAESPEDFIRRWVRAGDEMQVTGETAEYESLVDGTCKACISFVESVKDVYSNGGSVDFAGSEVNAIKRREPKPPTFALTKTLPRTVIRRQQGSQPEVLPPGRTTLLVILKQKPDGWAISYYGIL
ncbi:hypothetical protein NYO98_10980 [Nocardioides sp. STR2]|uniref:Lipoprotein n=1 Tax=Nocardioides pini TaxID=2975053 RepID=A0ABT4CCV0_9ACTN|nr:hypothetical protein [Nocardioides pini]MCY4726800.1 hypothetical protein [Nocardioides pini]